MDICQILNNSETIFAGTNLGLIYKFATPQNPKD